MRKIHSAVSAEMLCGTFSCAKSICISCCSPNSPQKAFTPTTRPKLSTQLADAIIKFVESVAYFDGRVPRSSPNFSRSIAIIASRCCSRHGVRGRFERTPHSSSLLECFLILDGVSRQGIVTRTLNSLSGTVNSASPHSKQTNNFGKVHTIGSCRTRYSGEIDCYVSTEVSVISEAHLLQGHDYSLRFRSESILPKTARKDQQPWSPFRVESWWKHRSKNVPHRQRASRRYKPATRNVSS
jgi:hypothetical protein